jgi:hypothetical protein
MTVGINAGKVTKHSTGGSSCGSGSWGRSDGEAVAKALVEGYGEKGKPFHGYYFKILKGKGPDATLGKLDYMIEGAMISGFALVAVPHRLSRHWRKDLHG